MQIYNLNLKHQNSTNQCHRTSPVLDVPVGILQVPMVYIGSLRTGLALTGTVPRGRRISGVVHQQPLSIVYVHLESDNLERDRTAKSIVLFFVGSEDVGPPYRPYLLRNTEGGVGTTMVAVASLQSNDNTIGQWMMKLSARVCSIECDAVVEAPCRGDATLRTIGKVHRWKVEVDKRKREFHT